MTGSKEKISSGLKTKFLFPGLMTNRGDNLFLLAILLFQLLFIFQGLDFVDEGMYASMYQQIFTDPESYQYMFFYWLTAVVGGLWLKLFPGLGLLGLRIAEVLVTTAYIIIIYSWLKEYVKRPNLRAGIFLALVLQGYDASWAFNYNSFSVFVWISASWLLFEGLRKDRLQLIMISGVLMGISIFIRLTNLLGLAMVLSLFYYGWLTGTLFRRQLRQALVFAGGTVMAAIMVLLAMRLMGHLSLYKGSLYQSITMSTSAEDAHNFVLIFKRMTLQVMRGMLYAGLFLISALLFTVYLQSKKLQENKNNTLTLVLFVVATLILILSFTGIFDGNQVKLFVVGILILSCISVLFNRRYSPLFRLLTFLALVLLFCFPFGSAWGFLAGGKTAIWIALPLSVEALRDFSRMNVSITTETDSSEKTSFTFHKLKLIPDLFLLVSILTGLVFAFSSPYNDKSSRLELQYPINHDYLKGIYTTEERSRAINELLCADDQFVSPGDHVLAYGAIPMYHFLSETVPYFRNPWPTLYTTGMMSNAIKTASRERDSLPVVVLQKVSTTNSDWPKNNGRSYDLLNSKNSRDRLFQEFIRNNRYETVWENNSFAIMISSFHDNIDHNND